MEVQKEIYCVNLLLLKFQKITFLKILLSWMSS